MAISNLRYDLFRNDEVDFGNIREDVEPLQVQEVDEDACVEGGRSCRVAGGSDSHLPFLPTAIFVPKSMSIPGRPEFRQNDFRRLRFADSDFFDCTFQADVVDIGQGSQLP